VNAVTSTEAQGMTVEEARQVLADSALIFDADAVQSAVRRMACAVTKALGESNPVVVVVMHGGIYLAGQILPLLEFPLSVDYLHVTRYGMATTGGELHWRADPSASVQGRAVLVLDDILDAGHTLAAVRDRLRAAGAASVHCAVLTEKETGKPKPMNADFVGLKLPDRYVFGCGMDVKGAWRNLPSIRAVKGS
jgi:hypoxanthine phosphoribosyltransferase